MMCRTKNVLRTSDEISGTWELPPRYQHYPLAYTPGCCFVWWWANSCREWAYLLFEPKSTMTMWLWYIYQFRRENDRSEYVKDPPYLRKALYSPSYPKSSVWEKTNEIVWSENSFGPQNDTIFLTHTYDNSLYKESLPLLYPSYSIVGWYGYPLPSSWCHARLYCAW